MASGQLASEGVTRVIRSTGCSNNGQELELARGRYSDLGLMEIRLVLIVHSDTPGPINSDLPSFSTTPHHVPNSTTVGGPFSAWGWEFFPSLLPKQSHYRRVPQKNRAPAGQQRGESCPNIDRNYVYVQLTRWSPRITESMLRK